jgi:hypothetical protein
MSLAQATELVHACETFERSCESFDRSWIHVLVLRQQRDALMKKIQKAVENENYPRAEELEPLLQRALKEARVEDQAIPLKQNKLLAERLDLSYRLHIISQSLIQQREKAFAKRQWGEVHTVKQSLEKVRGATESLVRLGRPEELRPIVCYMAVILRTKNLYVTAYDSTKVYPLYETLSKEPIEYVEGARFRTYSTAMQAMSSKSAKALEDDARLCLKCVATGKHRLVGNGLIQSAQLTSLQIVHNPKREELARPTQRYHDALAASDLHFVVQREQLLLQRRLSSRNALVSATEAAFGAAQAAELSLQAAEEALLEDFSFYPELWGAKGAHFCKQLYERMTRRERAHEAAKYEAEELLAVSASVKDRVAKRTAVIEASLVASGEQQPETFAAKGRRRASQYFSDVLNPDKPKSARDKLLAMMEQMQLRPADVFKAIDANNDRHVTRKELEEGLAALGCKGELAMTEEDITGLLSDMDMDLDGEVDLKEWRRELESAYRRTHGRMRQQRQKAATNPLQPALAQLPAQHGNISSRRLSQISMSR